MIRYQNTNQAYLWNVWKLTTSPSYSLTIIHEQDNDDSRYNGLQTLNAYTVAFTSNQLKVASIAQGYDPYLNLFGYDGSCNTGLYNVGAGVCGFCVSTMPSCKQCSSAPICQDCYPFKYLDSSKNCVACPANCYRCSSASNCLSCVGGYVWNSNSCVQHNITGCGTA